MIKTFDIDPEDLLRRAVAGHNKQKGSKPIEIDLIVKENGATELKLKCEGRLIYNSASPDLEIEYWGTIFGLMMAYFEKASRDGTDWSKGTLN